VYCNRREGFSGDRERRHHSVREGSRLLGYLAKVTSANIIFELTSHRHRIEIFGAVFEAVLRSHMGHLFTVDSNDITHDVGSFMDGLIENIWTLSPVILPSFKKKTVDKYPTRMVGVLSDNVIDWIRGCGFSKAVMPVAFEVWGELEGPNINGSGGLVRERVIVIASGIRAW